MAIVELFSKRQKRARGDVPDVYTYDDVPRQLRVQIVQILRDALDGDPISVSASARVYRVYTRFHDILCREYGVFRLSEELAGDQAVFEFFLNTEETEKALDVVELGFRFVQNVASKLDYRKNVRPTVSAESAIAELNARLRDQGVGYQFESGELIRVDSTLLHSEVVKPTLAFLRELHFTGANDEFLKAHEHYRHERYKECIAECLKAFESVMKVICARRQWPYDDTDTAKKLIDICFSKGLIPPPLQSEFAALRSLLESGLPTVRNRVGGHGQGTQVIEVPEHLAGYALHMTGATILFLAKSEQELD